MEEEEDIDPQQLDPFRDARKISELA